MLRTISRSRLASRKWAAPCFGAVILALNAVTASEAPHLATPEARPTTIATNDYMFGVVKLDKNKRAASFPAVINQRTGIVEYAVVTAAGKTHESIFRTEAQPVHVHVAMLLLGAKPASTNFRANDISIPPPGEPVTVEVSWTDGSRVIRRALEELIVTSNGNRALAAGPWAYNGSYLMRRTFAAQREGSIVSVHIDPDALVNNPRPGREHDELHWVNTRLLPADEVPVEITLRLPTEAPTGAPTAAAPNPNPATPVAEHSRKP